MAQGKIRVGQISLSTRSHKSILLKKRPRRPTSPLDKNGTNFCYICPNFKYNIFNQSLYLTYTHDTTIRINLVKVSFRLNYAKW